jgi:hypothetical protein
MSNELNSALHQHSMFARRGHSFALSFALGALGFLSAASVSAQVNVTTAQNDISRSGQNLNETALTPSTVNATNFGKLYSRPVTGVIGAQPLYVSNFSVNGAVHDVVFVATKSDFVYAFDANSSQGATAAPLWQVTLLDAAHGAAAGAQLYGSLGITSTPVIDP